MAKVFRKIEPTETDLAYIAGLVDGEGSIAVYKNGRSHRVQVSVKMCDSEAIEFLGTRYDCTVSFYISNLNKVVHKFYVGNGAAYRFLQNIRPYLKVKAKQADVAINFYENCGSVEGIRLTDEQVRFSEECCQLLKEMKVIPVVAVAS